MKQQMFLMDLYVLLMLIVSNVLNSKINRVGMHLGEIHFSIIVHIFNTGMENTSIPHLDKHRKISMPM